MVFPSYAFLSSGYAVAAVVQLPVLAYTSSSQFFSIVRSAMASASFHILTALFAVVPSVLGAFSIAIDGLA